MRKIKSDRKVQQFKNKLGSFYEHWICPELHVAEIENMTDKEMNKKITLLKRAVDITYFELRAEDKYMYYCNLYYLYEMLCIYFEKENLFCKKRNAEPDDRQTTKEKFGYEPAFSKEVHRKAEDGLHWLSCCLFKLIKKYSVVVKDYKGLMELVEGKILKSPKNIDKKIDGLEDEVAYIDKMIARIKFAKRNIEIVYSLEEKNAENDKKTRAMVKGTLTRVEKLLNILVQDIKDDEIVVAA